MGKVTVDISMSLDGFIAGPNGSRENPLGDTPPFHVPVFVLTHHAREPLVKDGGTTFTFVTDGIASALRQAQAVAGEKDVSVAGGADEEIWAASLQYVRKVRGTR